MDELGSGLGGADVPAVLLDWLGDEANVRVALVNGSRANPQYHADLLSDWDILCAVRNLAAFEGDAHWLGRMGRPLLVQRPNDGPGRIAWLVVFDDGMRVDFSFVPLETIAREAAGDSLKRLLLDKDGLLPPLPPADDRSYWIAAPSASEFAACVNEYWWVAVYVAKGLWRQQLPYARRHMECIVRPELERVLGWWASANADWQLNLGASNKHLRTALPPERWDAYVATHADADPDRQWAALDTACALMQRVGPQVATCLGYTWNADEAAGALTLIAAIRATPPNATSLEFT